MHFQIVWFLGNKICQVCFKTHMIQCVRKPTIWVSEQVNTNQPIQSQKQGRNLKFRIKVEKRLYYPCRENKGADQLRSHCEADLRLCFRLCKLLIFSCEGSYSFPYLLFFFDIIFNLLPQPNPSPFCSLI